MSASTSSGRKLQLPYAVYHDKVLGGWIGKSLGGIVGAPFEAHKILGDMTAENCWPKEIAPNDDLDIQVIWLEMLEERGPDFTRKDLMELWQDRCWYNFAEYGFFLYNAQRGINPPLSGRFNNTFFSQSMGCPIRAEIWGLAAPGNPELAAEYARMDGEQDHIENSVWAEQFWAAAVASAFFTDDLETALNAGRAVIPQDSDDYRISFEVPELYARFNGDYKRIWKDLIRTYGHRDCSKGLIDFAFTLLSLYVGKGDLKETIVTAINLGWDTDCTAATAAALLGVMQGAAALPEDWKARMGENLASDVDARRYKTAPLVDFATGTCTVGIEATFARNPLVEITDVPEDVMQLASDRHASRPAPNPVAITSSYPEQPVLYRDEPTPVLLTIEYSGTAVSSGKLSISAPEGVIVSPSASSLTLTPGSTHEVLLNVQRDGTTGIIWDKNLFEAEWTSSVGKASHVFGLAGARQWAVYGPYWDTWNKERWAVSPYRNDERICHPVYVDGCQDLLYKNLVNLKEAYLDEATLLTGDLPQEIAYLVEKGEDHIDYPDLGGFVGEACYYFVREFVADGPIECGVSIGSTAPMVVWLDGQEVCRREKPSTWFYGDGAFAARFSKTPRRMVIKVAIPADDFRFSISFIKADIPGDKTVGIAANLDCFGDAVR